MRRVEAPGNWDYFVNILRFLPFRCWLGMAVFWLVAALLRWWAAPAFERLPADYLAETSYAAKFQFHYAPSSPAEESESIVRRRDQTLTSGPRHSIIQGDVHWASPTGVVLFETLNLYGVDRQNRQNLAGFGNKDRAGQYLFPPHTGKQRYGVWDPFYAGPLVATFDHVDQFRGLEVYVFNSVADGVDETDGFVSLPDVPEKYSALSYGKSRLWIEPVSGVVVNFEDAGTSYFVEPTTGRHVGEPIFLWTARYTPETINAQLKFATATRLRMLALEIWLPLTLAVAGLLWIALGFRGARGGKQ